MKGNFNKILCVLTDTHKQDEVVAQALHIAKSHQAELTILLKLEALPPNANMVMQSFAYLEKQSSIESAAGAWLDGQLKAWVGDYPVTTDVQIGQSYVELVQHIMVHHYDLVLKLSDSGFIERLFGSDDLTLLRKCPVPVWIVHPGNSQQYDSVVAALDLNYHYPEHEISVRRKLNMDILRYAARIALMEFSQLHIVHVYDAVPESILRGDFISVDENSLEADLQTIYAEREAELTRLLGELDKELHEGALESLNPQQHIVRGYPRREIAATAKSVDAKAVVMGTVARLGVPGFIMGGTAEETIHQLDCALLGIKPDGFISPVSMPDN